MGEANTIERVKFTRIVGAGEVSGLIQIQRLGRIRLGVKKQKEGTDTTYPSETQHFVCPDEVQAVYGKEPAKLEGMFVSNNPEEVYLEKLALYGQGKNIKCHGNGKVAEEWDDQKQTWKSRSCPCEQFKSDQNPKGQCRPQGDLMVMLPTVNPWGLYQITTRSTYARAGILSALKGLMATMKRFTGEERIAGVPINITRVPRDTNHKGKKRTHYILTFTPALTLAQLMALRDDPDQLVLPAAYQNAQLPAPVDENPAAGPPDVVVSGEEDDDEPDDVIDTNGQVDAAALADMSDEQMDQVRQRLNHQSGQAAPAPAKPTFDLRFDEVLAVIKDDPKLVEIQGVVGVSMNLKQPDRMNLNTAGQEEFVKRFRDEAKRRGVDRLPF